MRLSNEAIRNDIEGHAVAERSCIFFRRISHRQARFLQPIYGLRDDCEHTVRCDIEFQTGIEEGWQESGVVCPGSVPKLSCRDEGSEDQVVEVLFALSVM